MADISNFKLDSKISFSDGFKLYFKKMFKWGGYCTKYEYGWGFLTSLLAGLVLTIVAMVSFAPLIFSIFHATSDCAGKTYGTTAYTNCVNGGAGYILASLGGSLIVLFVAIVVCIPLAIASWSLSIRRLRSAGVSLPWIVAALLVPIGLSWTFISVLSFVINIATLVICFARPSIADRGYEYSYWDVLTNAYKSPKPVQGFAPPMATTEQATNESQASSVPEQSQSTEQASSEPEQPNT